MVGFVVATKAFRDRGASLTIDLSAKKASIATIMELHIGISFTFSFPFISFFMFLKTKRTIRPKTESGNRGFEKHCSCRWPWYGDYW